MSQQFVGTPFFRQFHRGASKIAVVLVKLRLEAAEQRKSVGSRAGESGENLILIQAANFFLAMLDNGIAERDLSIPGHDDFAITADTQNRGGTDSGSLRFRSTLAGSCHCWK